MSENRLYEDVKLRLEKLNIYEVRQVARAVGVHRPADGKKSRVISAILDIAEGKVAPIALSLRGAPPKSAAYDEALVSDIKLCREYSLAKRGDNFQPAGVLTVCDSGAAEVSAFCGVLFFDGKNYFARVNGEDAAVLVHESFVNRFCLREGDLIEGERRRRNESSGYGLSGITSINGKPAETLSRRNFSALTHVYPAVKLNLSKNNELTALKIIDLFSPLALGQRACVCAPAKSGKTTLLKQIASAICCEYPEISVLVSLIDERPEDLNDFKRSVKNCEFYCTSFDMPAESHMREVKLCFERAKRIVESGGNAVILFDGITRFVRAFGLSAHTGNSAVEEIKKLLYCACNAEEGGSLTVIYTLATDAADSAKDAAVSEFRQLANMSVTLSSELAKKRVFPAIYAGECYADRENTLLGAEEINAAAKLRAKSCEQVVEIFSKSTLGEIIEKYGN